MSVIGKLIETAASDTDLLRSLDAQGDDFAIPRDVDFLLRAPSKEKSEIAASFINECQFGVATAQESDGEHSVLVVVHMPIQQHVILSVSGFMGCICELYGLDYDGWGCITQLRP
jgi:hypothetical protein